MISMIGAFVVGVVCAAIFDGRKPSFVALTETSLNARKQSLLNYESSGKHMVWTVLLSIALSVIANFLYDYWCKERFFAGADALLKLLPNQAIENKK